MSWLIITTPDVLSLAAINAEHEDRRIEPIPTADGTLIVSSDLLADEYWLDWHPLLSSLEALGSDPVWPEPSNTI